MKTIPELPQNEFWTPVMIATAVNVPPRTVSYWCKATFGECGGKRKLTRDDAQRVVNRLFTFGRAK